MGISWHNKYEDLPTTVNGHSNPEFAQIYADQEGMLHFTLVEMRINGHWHRPPVGMRGDQASHIYWFNADRGWYLEARK